MKKLIEILNLLNNEGYTYDLEYFNNNNLIINILNYDLDNINIYNNNYYIYYKNSQWIKINYQDLLVIIIDRAY